LENQSFDVRNTVFIDDHLENIGYVDNISNLPFVVKISGWSMDPYEKNPTGINILFFREDEEYITSVTPCIYRPDVVNAFQNAQLANCGWAVYIHKNLLLSSQNQTIFCYVFIPKLNVALRIQNNVPEITAKQIEDNTYRECTIDIVGGCNASCFWCPSGCHEEKKRLTFTAYTDFVHRITYPR
jgi:hypothetical protein